MKTEYEIYMDFRRAREQANELRVIANRMEHLSDAELGGTLRSIQQNWSGENAQKFNGKGVTLQRKINVTAADLRKVAATIDSIATRTYNNELNAVRIAKTRG